jgi:RNA-directed DNA polymerase
MSEAKPFCISKWEVWEAYKRVRANHGAAGVDDQSIVDFERDLKGNLYKIWNRMSSGSYFPPPVRTVKLPKANGGERKLGIPTVSDRIAQQVVKSRLEPAVDPLRILTGIDRGSRHWMQWGRRGSDAGAMTGF